MRKISLFGVGFCVLACVLPMQIRSLCFSFMEIARILKELEGKFWNFEEIHSFFVMGFFADTVSDQKRSSTLSIFEFRPRVFTCLFDVFRRVSDCDGVEIP